MKCGYRIQDVRTVLTIKVLVVQDPPLQTDTLTKKNNNIEMSYIYIYNLIPINLLNYSKQLLKNV
jgi:hypothetical protein